MRPLQNRVTPTSQIERNPARGMFMGNRGILHNDTLTLITTKWRHKNWVLCTLKHKNWHRKIMTPRRYTELFFLDEATALAAGHRPCALCQRSRYRQFMDAAGFSQAKMLDTALHADRKRHHFDGIDYPSVPVSALANGTFIVNPDHPQKIYLYKDQHYYSWAHAGYGPAYKLALSRVRLVTPLTTLKTLQNGYQPVIHESAS